MHRTDAPQGEKEKMVLHRTPPEFETQVRDDRRDPDYVSREVPLLQMRQEELKHARRQVQLQTQHGHRCY